MPTVSVCLSHDKDQTFTVNEGIVIFEELERLGLILPHGCLAGSCGACKIVVLEGAENLTPMGTVEADTVEFIKNNEAFLNKNIRLSCRAKATGNIKIATIK